MVLPIYSVVPPVKVLNVDSKDYVNEHLTHFFDVYSMKCMLNSSQEMKERSFELLTKHEDLLVTMLGESILNSQIFLPKLLRAGVNTPLVEEYKQWLSKQ
jgi:hypothetical protein